MRLGTLATYDSKGWNPVPIIVIVLQQENSWGVERYRVRPIGSDDSFVANADSLIHLDLNRGRDAIAADLDFLTYGRVIGKSQIPYDATLRGLESGDGSIKL